MFHPGGVNDSHPLSTSETGSLGSEKDLVTNIFVIIPRKLRKDVAAKILIHLCVALCCVLIVFISGAERKDMSLITCRVVAILLHYFLLVAFMWMLTEGYFMYQAFVKVWRADYGEYVLLKCSFLAWGNVSFFRSVE